MKKYFLFIIAGLIIASSCSKKDQDYIVLTGTQLKKKTSENNRIEEYDYYTDGRLKEKRLFNGWQQSFIYKYSYSIDTMWEKTTHILNSLDTLYGNTKYYNLSPDTTIGINENYEDAYSLYIFSGEPCSLIKSLEYNGSYLIRETSYEYLDEHCSESITEYSNGIEYKKVLIRDNNPSWENSITLPYLRKNFIGSIIEESYYRDNVFIFSKKYRYNVNADNYPLGKREDYLNSRFTDFYEYY